MSNIACWVVAWAVVGADMEQPAARATYSIEIVRPGGDLPVVGRLMSNVGIANVEPERIGYEVGVITLPAAEWRGVLSPLQGVGREGRATVWTLDEKTAKEMTGRSMATKPASIVCARGSRRSGGGDRDHAESPHVLRRRRPRADGPVDHAGAIKLEPSAEEVDEGLSVSLKGQKTADGIRVHVKAESTWVGHVARASTRERIENKQFGKTSPAPARVAAGRRGEDRRRLRDPRRPADARDSLGRR